jgi:hypothetical protein
MGHNVVREWIHHYHSSSHYLFKENKHNTQRSDKFLACEMVTVSIDVCFWSCETY